MTQGAQEEKRKRGRRFHWPNVTRDTVLFVGGLAGLFNEAVLSKGERPTLIFAFMAMIGLPAFLHADERKRDDDK